MNTWCCGGAIVGWRRAIDDGVGVHDGGASANAARKHEHLHQRIGRSSWSDDWWWFHTSEHPPPNTTHSSETPRSADTRVYRAGRYRPETHRYRSEANPKQSEQTANTHTTTATTFTQLTHSASKSQKNNVTGWPLYDIAITIMVWCMADKRGSWGGVINCAIFVQQCCNSVGKAGGGGNKKMID